MKPDYLQIKQEIMVELITTHETNHGPIQSEYELWLMEMEATRRTKQLMNQWEGENESE